MAENGTRTWPRRIYAVLCSILLLLLLEAVLRGLDFAPPEKPARELFLNPSPVFAREGEVLRTRDEKRKHFAAQSFPARKGRGITRIFITGGSTAMGFPLHGAFGPAELVAAALSEALPGAGFQVINAGAFGYNSLRVSFVVEELLAYDPDVLVVMSGHNEYLEYRFRHRAGEGPGMLARLRVYRVLAGAVSAVRGELDEVRWEAHRVSGKERELVRADFRRNLDRIARMCRREQAPLILVTCPANIQDYMPNGASRALRKEQEEIDKAIKEATPESIEKAMEAISQWGERFPRDAWLRYEKGVAWRQRARAHMELAQEGATADRTSKAALAKANTLFEEARDLDPVPVRATSEINRLIRETAREHGLTLSDVDKRFHDLRSSVASPDAKRFFDHCHPDFEGQEELATMVLRALERTAAVGLPEGWETSARNAWERLLEATPDPVLAESCYYIAYESGVNMDRPHRGLEYARLALRLDPAHSKALRLINRIGPEARSRYRLTGE